SKTAGASVVSLALAHLGFGHTGIDLVILNGDFGELAAGLRDGDLERYLHTVDGTQVGPDLLDRSLRAGVGLLLRQSRFLVDEQAHGSAALVGDIENAGARVIHGT